MIAFCSIICSFFSDFNTDLLCSYDKSRDIEKVDGGTDGGQLRAFGVDEGRRLLSGTFVHELDIRAWFGGER